MTSSRPNFDIQIGAINGQFIFFHSIHSTFFHSVEFRPILPNFLTIQNFNL